MATRSVNLTKRLDDFVEKGVSSGRYGNGSEVVREGLRLLEKQEREEAAWDAYVVKEAQEGIDDIERGDCVLIESDEDLDRIMAEIFDRAKGEAEGRPLECLGSRDLRFPQRPFATSARS